MEDRLTFLLDLGPALDNLHLSLDTPTMRYLTQWHCRVGNFQGLKFFYGFVDNQLATKIDELLKNFPLLHILGKFMTTIAILFVSTNNNENEKYSQSAL